MKAKITYTGLLLAVIFAACNTTNSPKAFNPQVDGLWKIDAIIRIQPCGDEYSDCNQVHDVAWVSIEYPRLHVCYERFSETDGHVIKAPKEDITVIHKNENRYRIQTDNGDPASRDSSIIQLKKLDNGKLGIYRKFADKGLEGVNYSYAGANEMELPVTADYRACRKKATYSKDALH